MWKHSFCSKKSDKAVDKSADKTRDHLLVVVTLIAAVTFQAGVNPPGGVWQDNGGCKNTTSNTTSIAAVNFQSEAIPLNWYQHDNKNCEHKAGTAIYASQKVAFYVFLVSNTVALSTSVRVIMALTYDTHFQLEVWFATASMLATYASAVFAVTPDSHKFRYVLIAAIVPFAVRCLIDIFKTFKSNTTGTGEAKDQQNGKRQKDEDEQAAEA